ncbi:hypothetical protein A0J61_05690 [Choanephora cucurbitarum]|uniref:C2H2-type domain-containing protein n=1 Tax=Choanephora cucurbitarum TaxID=101091 RepID=A0A1C7NAZ2_9FUNG|nr:hypothetical protein A0J61_05690 [Choanephora cucurbitarum]
MNKVNSQHSPLNHHNKDFSPPPLISLSISSDHVSPIKEQFIMKIDSQQKSTTPVSPTQDFSSLFGQFSLKTVPSSPYENQKIFTCIECGQTFNRAHNLKSHKATHSATKPFQVNTKTLPNPFLSPDQPTIPSPTLPPPILSSSSSSSPPLPSPKTSPSKTSLPPFLLPFSNSTTDQDEIDVLRQRIHDLEVENRVLRSLLCNKEEDDLSKPKRQRSP